jgi:hypothetical protein
MKRPFMLFTMVAVAGLVSSAGLVGASGVASASTGSAAQSKPAGIRISGMGRVNPGGLIRLAPAEDQEATNSPTGQSQYTQLPTISTNWSGYADVPLEEGQYFSSVSTTFRQPKLTCPGVKDQFTSNWVGLDGFVTDSVEQTGTMAYCAGKKHKTPEYFAWYEMYPAQASIEVFSVHPGDLIHASVTSTGTGGFTMTVTDATTGKTKVHSATCSPDTSSETCLSQSAEWIIERPGLCNNAGTKCYLAELADFHSTQMREDTASVSSAPGVAGSPQSAASFPNWPIYMIGPLKKGFISLDTVSNLSSSGAAFKATWDRPGTKTPLT